MLNPFWPRIHLKILVIIVIGSFSGLSRSETESEPVPGSAAHRFQSIWDAATLYQNPDNPVIQSFSLVGRYHGQYWSVDADQGKADGWDNRRMIFGFQSGIYRDFQVELQMKINDDFSPVYDELYTAFVAWSPEKKDFSAVLGRVDYVFIGMERSTSSKKISTFERGLLAGQLTPGEAVGLHLRTKFDALTVHTGVYSGSINEEFSDFDAGIAAELGFEFGLPLLYDKGTLHLDILYNDGNQDNNAFKPYRQVVSLWHRGNKGSFGLGMDLTSGSGGLDGQADVLGFTLLPTYDLSNSLLIGGDKLQLALRYQYVDSDGENGLILQKRYEQEVTTGRGDKYQAFYTGLNYLLYGDRLKFMAGAEFSKMEDSANDGGEFEGWTYLVGLRLFF
jgi:phosphate-selective porin OprO/OprP